MPFNYVNPRSVVIMDNASIRYVEEVTDNASIRYVEEVTDFVSYHSIRLI